MKKLAIMAVIALGSGLASAADDAKSGGAGTTTPSSNTAIGKPADKGAADVYLASEYWTKHAKDGYMSKDVALQFKGADGKSVDWGRLDADNDGKVSEREWKQYHQTAGAAGLGASGDASTKASSDGNTTR